ncbi:hypothetical protein ABZ354_07320 [Streptomyces sp. NPDC005925]|uniref:WD40 repeat domain-containing protein n=1 Tax=Streptomyces sp. NPDC005925 TaxID=3157172 RepID=UPI0033D4C83D
MSETSDSRNADIHRQIAAALANLVPTDPTIPPHPYLRRYLAQHAADGDVLDDEHVPPALLAWETSSDVRRLLATRDEGSEGRQWLRTWALLEPFAQLVDPLSRLSSMRLAHDSTTREPSPSREKRASAAQVFGAAPVTPLWSDSSPLAPAWTTVAREVTSLTTVAGAEGRAEAVAVGDSGGTLRILRRDGSLAHRPVPVHHGAITHLLALPGGLVVTAGTDGCVTVVDTAHGRPGRQVVIHRPKTWVSSLTLHRVDGHLPLVLTAFSDGHVAAFDTGRYQTWDVPLPELQDSQAVLCGVTRADDHACLLFTTHDKVHLFDGRTVVAHSQHPAPVRALLSLPQPNLYAVADEGGNLSVHDLSDTSGSSTPVATAVHRAPVTALLLTSVDGRPALASSAGDGTVRLWLLPHLQPVGGDLAAHDGPVNAMTRLPDDAHDRLLTGGADRMVRRWPVGRPTFTRPPRAWSRITARALSPAPHLLAVARAARVVVRDLASGHQRTMLKGHEVTALAWPRLQGRPVLAAALSDNSVICVDPVTGHRIGAPLIGHFLPVKTLVAVSASRGELLISGSSDGRLCVWDLSSGELLKDIGDHQYTVHCLATRQVSGTTLVASGGGDGRVRVWDMNTLEQHGRTIDCDQDVINDLTFVQERGRLLVVSAGRDGTLKLWDDRTGEKTGELVFRDGELSAVTSMHLPQDRTALAAAGATSIHVWDTTTHRQLLRIVTGSPVHALKTVQDPGGEKYSILLAAGVSGTMAFRLQHEQLW